MALWDQGYDIHQIVITMFEHEHVVAFALRIGLERYARVMRGEPAMITNGTSPASQCVELGASAVRVMLRGPQ